jgi:hypothetical protein
LSALRRDGHLVVHDRLTEDGCQGGELRSPPCATKRSLPHKPRPHERCGRRRWSSGSSALACGHSSGPTAPSSTREADCD